MFETDTEVTYVYNGTVWADLSPSRYFRKGTTPDRRYIGGLSYKATTQLVLSTTAPALDTLWALPFIVPRKQSFDLLTIRISTVATTGGVARTGIYKDDGSCYPGALYFDSGSIDTTTPAAPSNRDTTITSGLQPFEPGLYWLAVVFGVAAPQLHCLRDGTQLEYILGNGSAFSVTANGGYGYSVAHAFAALPNPYTAGGTVLTVAPSATAPVAAIGVRPI
jgi:hypothetical protein